MNEKQQDFDFSARTHARRTDADTSHAAALAVRGAKVLMARILESLIEHGPQTQSELAARLALRPDQVWRRISDLKNQARIVPTPKRRLGSTGRMQIVWEAI